MYKKNKFNYIRDQCVATMVCLKSPRHRQGEADEIVLPSRRTNECVNQDALNNWAQLLDSMLWRQHRDTYCILIL